MKRCNTRISKGPAGLQTVFRVKGTRAREKVANSEEGHKSTFNARRSHKKSRAGCQNCKLRRVKCDETRSGGCLRCQQYGIDCDYLVHKSPHSETVNVGGNVPHGFTPLPISHPPCAATTPKTVRTVFVVPSLSPPTPFRYELPAEITPFWQTLHHFEIVTCATVSSPAGQEVFATSVLAIAHQNDYLMHAILGTAAAHLAWQAKRSDAAAELRRHRQAEAYHWHRALSGFRSCISRLEQETATTADAMLSIGMLLCTHSYILSDNKDETSFVWKPEHERLEALRWLTLQSGFGLLLHSLGGRAALSVWLDVFNSAASEEFGFQWNFDSAQGIFGDFQDICGINQHSTMETNPYFNAINGLFALLEMGPPAMTAFASLMAFMGRLTGPFQELLVQRDRAALLIVAHWLVLVHHLQLWWIRDRAKHECTAIVTFLAMDEDARVQRLLAIPAMVMDINMPNTTLPTTI